MKKQKFILWGALFLSTTLSWGATQADTDDRYQQTASFSKDTADMEAEWDNLVGALRVLPRGYLPLSFFNLKTEAFFNALAAAQRKIGQNFCVSPLSVLLMMTARDPEIYNYLLPKTLSVFTTIAEPCPAGHKPLGKDVAHYEIGAMPLQEIKAAIEKNVEKVTKGKIPFQADLSDRYSTTISALAFSGVFKDAFPEKTISLPFTTFDGRRVSVDAFSDEQPRTILCLSKDFFLIPFSQMDSFFWFKKGSDLKTSSEDPWIKKGSVEAFVTIPNLGSILSEYKFSIGNSDFSHKTFFEMTYAGVEVAAISEFVAKGSSPRKIVLDGPFSYGVSVNGHQVLSGVYYGPQA